jgi:hypothetical protein
VKRYAVVPTGSGAGGEKVDIMAAASERNGKRESRGADTGERTF